MKPTQLAALSVLAVALCAGCSSVVVAPADLDALAAEVAAIASNAFAQIQAPETNSVPGDNVEVPPPAVSNPPPSAAGLPQNPCTGLSKPDSISEEFTAKRKSGDATYRFTWPSYFSNKMGIGKGSSCTANGLVCTYRGQDKDRGSNRPKYTLPIANKLDGAVLFVLYDAAGKALGWIECPIGGGGYLPAQDCTGKTEP